MIYVVTGLAVTGGMVLAALSRRATVRRLEARRLWAVASANTSDGVTARTGVEFVVHLPDNEAEAGALTDAVEDLLRREISSSTAEELPSIGDDPGFLAGATVEGVAIERAVVTASEVEVTPELRRLLVAGAHLPGTS